MARQVSKHQDSSAAAGEMIRSQPCSRSHVTQRHGGTEIPHDFAPSGAPKKTSVNNKSLVSELLNSQLVFSGVGAFAATKSMRCHELSRCHRAHVSSCWESFSYRRRDTSQTRRVREIRIDFVGREAAHVGTRKAQIQELLEFGLLIFAPFLVPMRQRREVDA